MARVATLFSSSKGNATYIGSANCGILIDAGASYRGIKTALDLCGIEIGAVKAVFVTHEHSDHIKGLKMLQKLHKLPIYASNGTMEYLIRNDLLDNENELYTVNKPCAVANMEISSFRTPHDSAQSVGYTISTEDERKIAFCTDLGEVTTEVANAISGCDLCVLEANYDEDMLSNNPMYPQYLKNRIRSGKGHLSNTASANEAKALIKNGTTRIVLGHLSQNNNRPEKAAHRVLSELSEFKIGIDYTLDVAPVSTVGKTIVF